MILCAEELQGNPVSVFPCPHLIQDALVAYACGRVHDCENTLVAGEKLKAILGERYFVYVSPRHIGIHYRNADGSVADERLAMFVDTEQKDSGIPSMVRFTRLRLG